MCSASNCACVPPQTHWMPRVDGLVRRSRRCVRGPPACRAPCLRSPRSPSVMDFTRPQGQPCYYQVHCHFLAWRLLIKSNWECGSLLSSQIGLPDPVSRFLSPWISTLIFLFSPLCQLFAWAYHLSFSNSTLCPLLLSLANAMTTAFAIVDPGECFLWNRLNPYSCVLSLIDS